MAESDIIRSEDIADIKPLLKDFKELLDITTKFKHEIQDSLKATQTTLQSNAGKGTTKAIDETTQALEKSTQQRLLLIEVEKAEYALQEKINVATIAEKKALQEELKLKTAEARELDRVNKLRAKEEKALKDQASAYKQASARLNDLRQKYKDMAIAGNASEQQLKELRLEIQKLDKNLKDVDAEVGQFNRSVGNYEGAINAAASGTGEFGTILSGIQGNLAAAKETLGAAITDIKNFGEGFRNAEGGIDKAKKAVGLFGSALKVSGIALLVAALASLAAYFKTTEEGGDQLGKTIAIVQAAFGEFVRTLAKAAPFIINIFKDIYKVGNATFQALTIGFRTTDGAIKGLGKSLYALATGEGKKALEEFNKIGTETTDKFTNLSDAFKNLQTTNFSENIKGIGDAFSGIGERIEKAGENAAIVFDLFDDLEEKQIRYAQQLQQLQAEETRLSSISSDATNSFRNRETAQQKLLEVSIKRAEKERDIAREEFELNAKRLALETGLTADVVKNTLIQGKAFGQLTVDRLKELNEFYLKATQADANLNQQVIQNEIDKREIQQQQLLTREKILQQLTTLELKQIRDIADAGANSFESREVAANKYAKLVEDTYQEEIKIINDANGGVIDANKVLTIKTAQQLEDYINSLGIKGKKVTQELSDIIANRLKEDENIAAINKKREDDLAKIEARNRSAQQKIEQEDFKRAGEIQDKIVKASAERFRKGTLNEIKKAYDLRRDAIIDQANFELQNAELTAKERLAIENKLVNDLARLNDQENDAKEKYNEALRNKRLDQAKEISDKVLSNLSDELQKENDLIANQLDRQLEQRQQNISAQLELFQNGQANQLQFEKEQQAKLELQRKDLAERAAKQQEAIALSEAYIQSFIARLKANEQPQQATLSAAGDVLLARAISKTVASFFEGTEDTGKVNDPLDSKGGRLAVLHDNERVIPKHLNEMIGNMSNETLAKIAHSHNLGTAHNINASLDLNPVVKKLNDVEKAISNKPSTSFELDVVGRLVEKRITNKITIKTTKHNPWK